MATSSRAADIELAVEQHAPSVLAALQSGADKTVEADLLAEVESSLRSFTDAIGASAAEAERRVIIHDPQNTKRSARIDRLFNTVVVEFEPPRSLKPVNESQANRHAIGQVQEQLQGLVGEGYAEETASGVVCDGARFVFCRRTSGAWIVQLQSAPGPRPG